MLEALIKSMRLRTLPLSLAGVVCGGLLAAAPHSPLEDGKAFPYASFILLLLTACLLQILSNLSNEMGDHLSGVDGEGREGPNYGMTDGGLTVKQMWPAINGTVVACCVSGLAMVLVSGCPLWTLLVGAAAIWAATHYTLGKTPYGYKGLGDLFVFIFFGLVSVVGGFFVISHIIVWKIWLLASAVGVGLLSVAVLNVNNIRDVQSDEGLRKTVPLRIGLRNARIYQTILVVAGVVLMSLQAYPCWVLAPLFIWHLVGVWRHNGRALDPMLPLLVISTFLLALLYASSWYMEFCLQAKYG